jgi:hypothetical protein
MAILSTLLVDGALLVGILISLMLATFWGELCGVEPNRDKSGLGGFVAVFLFLPVRWLCTLVGLAAALRAGTLPYLPQAGTGTACLVLGAHVALGVATAMLFNHGVNRVQRDLRAGEALGVAGAVVLPLPGLWLALLGAHPAWLAGPVARVLVAATLATVFWLGYRHRLADMRRSALASRRP